MSTKEDQEARDAMYFMVGVVVLYAMALACVAAGMSTVIGVLRLWGLL